MCFPVPAQAYHWIGRWPSRVTARPVSLPAKEPTRTFITPFASGASHEIRVPSGEISGYWRGALPNSSARGMSGGVLGAAGGAAAWAMPAQSATSARAIRAKVFTFPPVVRGSFRVTRTYASGSGRHWTIESSHGHYHVHE